MRYTILTGLASLLGAGAALAEVPRVVTDITPVSSLVGAVMGDLGAPVQLLDKGTDPHDFALRPSQMAAVSEAGLVIWVGPELTPALERALVSSPAARLGLLAAEGTHRQDFGEAGAHDHEHEHEAEADAEEHDHGHDHSGTDPHAWLDPENARHWLDLIAGELAALDPDNAATYRANAEAAKASVTAVETELAAQLTPVRDRPFVTYHDAYGYFTGHFGLAYGGSLSLGDASSPGAARLEALQAELAAGGIACAFPEAGHDPALLETVLAGSQTRLGAALDPEGLALDPAPGVYEAMLRGIGLALADCLSP